MRGSQQKICLRYLGLERQHLLSHRFVFNEQIALSWVKRGLTQGNQQKNCLRYLGLARQHLLSHRFVFNEDEHLTTWLNVLSKCMLAKRIHMKMYKFKA